MDIREITKKLGIDREDFEIPFTDEEAKGEFLCQEKELLPEPNEQAQREKEEALIEGVEFAMDNGMAVSDADLETYRSLMEQRKTNHLTDKPKKPKKGRSR